MNAQQLFEQIRDKSSYLCIGLDTDYDRLPKFLLDKEYPLYEFNRRIIKATADLVIAYKPNLAFYESLGAAGLMSLEMTVNYIRTHFPEIFIIADAKRGDIGNTSMMYAKTFLRHYDFDAITVSPYMGSDSIQPFLEYDGKWVIVLALTSNQGAEDFQLLRIAGKREYLYQKVINTCRQWGSNNNMMFVAGGTRPEYLRKIRKMIPDHFILIPGVGAQGASLEEITGSAMNKMCGLIVNASRSIIYADGTNKFDDAARKVAQGIQAEMSIYLKKAGLI